MGNDEDTSLADAFISEAAEMLEDMEAAFIRFESAPQNTEVIGQIFRLAHTLKGSGMCCGFSHFGEFAHVVEALLVRIRDQTLAPTPEVIDTLLKANDRFHAFVKAIKATGGDHGVVTEDLTSAIQRHLDTEGCGPAVSDATLLAPAWVPPDDVVRAATGAAAACLRLFCDLSMATDDTVATVKGAEALAEARMILEKINALRGRLSA